MKLNARYLFMELIQILHIPFGDAQLGSMLTVPPDWRSTRRVSELRTEPLWGLQCDRSESQAALFFKIAIDHARSQRAVNAPSTRIAMHCVALHISHVNSLSRVTREL
jgi:hypothetical protein